MILRATLTVSLLSVFTALGMACGAGGNNDIPSVSMTAREFNFDGPDTVPAGLVRLQLINGGTRAHFLGILSLTGGKTGDDSGQRRAEQRGWLAALLCT